MTDPDITTPEGRAELRNRLEDERASWLAKRPEMLRRRAEILDRKMRGDDTFGDDQLLAEVRADLDTVEGAVREHDLAIPLLTLVDQQAAEIARLRALGVREMVASFPGEISEEAAKAAGVSLGVSPEAVREIEAMERQQAAALARARGKLAFR